MTHIDRIKDIAHILAIDLDKWTLAADVRVPWRPDISPPSQCAEEHREITFENFEGEYTMIVTVQHHNEPTFKSAMWVVTSFSIRSHEGYN